jgi:hypothetical protein
MALKDFWISVKVGASLATPFRVIADAPRIDPEQIASAIAKTDAWLTPKTIQGFNPEDFSFLEAEEKDRLTTLVNDFLAIAKQVHPRGPATKEQVEQAKPIFQEIVETLEFDRFADAEAYRCGKTIEADPRYPKEDIEDIRYRTTTDSNGYPALRIMTYLTESEDQVFLNLAQHVRKQIRDIVEDLCAPYWPYVSTRTIDELALVQSIGADD